MKRILVMINLLLLGIIFFLGCHPFKNDPANNNPSGPTDSCMSRTCRSYEGQDVPGIISGQLLKTLSNRYADDLNKSRINYSMNGSASDTDAMSVSFDLEKIKNFIWHIEQAVCKINCPPTTEIGIRFYYIKYPNMQDTTGVPEELQGVFAEYANKHSLAMVPVYKVNGEWYDFDYTNVQSTCDFKPAKPNYFKNSAGVVLGLGDNHGGIGPPPGKGTYPTLEPSEE